MFEYTITKLKDRSDNMKEKFAVPCVGAIIEKTVDREHYILIQTRRKENGGMTNGLLEIPAGKIREYENIFDALRREVMEETGLTIVEIKGEKEQMRCVADGNLLLSFEPYCVTQNLSGVYSIVLNTFLCKAEGELVESTNETINIHWEKAAKVKELLTENENGFFMMHINALKKYLQ